MPPVITRPPQPQDVEEDAKVELYCQVEADTAYPVTKVIWMKDDHLINPVRVLYPQTHNIWDSY